MTKKKKDDEIELEKTTAETETVEMETDAVEELHEPEKLKEVLMSVEENANLEVKDLPGIGATRAKRLNEAGIFTIMDLGVCSPMEVKDVTGMDQEPCEELVKMAKDWLEEKDLVRKSLMTGRQVHEYRTRTIEHLTIGCSALDGLLGGGIETEAITEFYGVFACGKTQICHTATVETIQNNNASVIYIDTENTFRPERIIQIAIARGYAKDEEEAAQKFLDNIIVPRAYNAAHQIMIINHLNHFLAEDLEDKHKIDRKPKLLIVDSLTAHFRSEYLGRGNLNPRQSKIGAMMRKLGRVAENWKMGCIITNQVLSDPGKMFGDATKPVGGNVVGHISTYRVYIKRPGKNRVARLVDSPQDAEVEIPFDVDESGVINGGKE